MSYQGQIAAIRLGRGGLLTDQNPSDIPDTNLLIADNVDMQDGIIEKETGSARWNQVALASPIKALHDWHPLEAVQKLIVVCLDGTVWKYTDPETVSQITPATGAPAMLTVTDDILIIQGGQENPGDNKKLFLFTGNQQIQVITSDGSTYANLANPSADFATANYPRIGLVHANRLWVFTDHRAYVSDDDDHEQFASGGFQMPVFPGDSERIIAATVFKGRLYVFKRPRGIYFLEDSDTNSVNWYFRKLSDEFGASGPAAHIDVVNDFLISNSTGSITSMRAVQEFGDVASGDIFSLLNTESYLRQQISLAGLNERRAIYWSERKLALFAFRSAGSQQNDRTFKIDYSKQRPELTLSTKDQINAFVLRREDSQLIPYYGANDGYIYKIGIQDRVVRRIFSPNTALSAARDPNPEDLDNGTYLYVVTFGTSTQESLPGGPSNEITIVDNSVEGAITLSNIPIDLTGQATRRYIYRKNIGTNLWYLIYTIPDNVLTSLFDNVPDASATLQSPPAVSTFNTAYTMRFQTPHLDFGNLDPAIQRKNKIYDALEVTFIPTGRWNLSITYYIDGIEIETRNFTCSRGAVLDDFELDNDVLGGRRVNSIRMKLRGAGRTISFKCENAGSMQNCKVSELRVSFRPTDENQKESNSGRT